MVSLFWTLFVSPFISVSFFLCLFSSGTVATDPETFKKDFERGNSEKYIEFDFDGLYATRPLSSDNAFLGSFSLRDETSNSWPCITDESILTNNDFSLSQEDSYQITAYVFNTSSKTSDRPNGIVFSTKGDEYTGYVAVLGYDRHIKISTIGQNATLIAGKELSGASVIPYHWYKLILYFDPTRSYTKFEVYDLYENLLESIETYNTPYIGNGIGFRVNRGWSSTTLP